MSKILGIYRFTYKNGVSQIKNMISHDDYINIYKIYQDKIYDLERENKFKETNTTKQLKKDLKEFFGSEWFTDKSPLFNAIKTGNLEYAGYITNYLGPTLRTYPIYYNCIVEQIN